MAKRVYTQAFPAVNAVIEKDGNFLVVQQGKSKGIHEGYWAVPGGWIEAENDDPIGAVIREVKEETGLEFDPLGIVGIFSSENHKFKEYFGGIPHPIKIVFFGEVEGKIYPQDSNEIADTKWVGKEDLPKVKWRTPSDIEMFFSYLEGDKFPLSMIHHHVHK